MTHDSANAGREPLLRVADLTVAFDARRGWLERRRPTAPVVDGVGFELHPGRTLALVGESGSGKSTVARAILRLVPARGRVLLRGVDVLGAPHRALRRLRRDMQIVFQDPGGSLNPRRTVLDAVAEPIVVHRLAPTRDAVIARARDVLARCGLDPALGARYPHELSGGQRQRAAIARALGTSPALLVLDEPTSALDASVQAQILNLLRDLRRAFDLAMVFITHDMGVVRHVADEVAVMRAGRIVELGPATAVLDSPAHEYTRTLLAAVPSLAPTRRGAPRCSLG